MSATSYEQWKADWSTGFTPEAKESAVVMQHVITNRTFVRVEILSRGMFRTWFDLMYHNNPRLMPKAQLSTKIAGPCELFMCYLTSNHVDIADPTSVSCIGPMYVRHPYVCFQGLMRLEKTFVGTTEMDEQLPLVVMASRMAPRKSGLAFMYAFISPIPYVGTMLRQMLEKKGVGYSKCMAGTLVKVSSFHDSTGKCKCGLAIGAWDNVEIDTNSTPYKFIIPRIMYKEESIGCVNVPWATGYSYDLVRQTDNFTVEDEGIAALTAAYLDESDFLNTHAKDTSFLSILSGIDGIHVIDYAKLITIDPLEVKQLTTPSSGPASGSGP